MRTAFKNCLLLILCLLAIFAICGLCACEEGAKQAPNSNQESSHLDTTSDEKAGSTTISDLDGQELTVRYINVGQGDCSIISCNGHNMMIDGGDKSASNTVYTVLKKLDISYLDYIVITHTDADHCGGVAGALQQATVGTCFCSATTASSQAWKNVVKALDAQGKTITVPKVGDELKLGAATVSFLAPIYKHEDDNNNSIINKITFGKTSFLFTGDCEKEEETDLFNAKTDLSADVLKVSHHGSKYCTSGNFISRVRPKYSVISVGKNSYGHPGESTIKQLESFGSTVLRTDKQGDIVFVSDGKTVTLQ